MKKIILSFTLSLAFISLVAAPVVFGAGLVQCDEQNPAGCSLCALIATIKAVYDFITQLTIVLAVGYIMFGGYQMMISGANPGLYAKGKSHITQAFIGLAIVLSAWFFVDILMRALTDSGDIYGAPWRTLNCR
ncbi:hypothetical protein A2333_01890 [Candidatus Wolfebacteria bacterium RIFOXYB2_FULL_49_7]|uniref:Vitamin K epoxide reductase domain-containing protein n=1 Tax=Candidatus Wolfebacteria bacterium RIFOXYB1_FULL_54_12 TaxID=1802559 RepID=A0A1F8DVH7_9BACT|nr:MAG: hypothetical protein A2372_04170 [Candidatus Wolfebacteria bacterium RIFOXYB1_FULL_54_12]OGM95271.1 MAG: hypothetical protein A2333_01890 [Candidatus Wolfebacteria bacterium RIFOXYB2_FULL_49_7]